MAGLQITDQSGILTKSQRRYLLEAKDVEPDTERVIRSRIRDRTIEAVRDFEILDIGLSEADHEMIFKKGLGRDISPGGDHTPRTTKDMDREFSFRTGVGSGFSFLFKGMRLLGDDISEMEQLLGAAIGNAETRGGSWINDPEFTRVSASVAIELEEAHSPERLYNRLKQGTRLDDEELGRLVRAGKLSPEDLIKIQSIEEQHLKDGKEIFSSE